MDSILNMPDDDDDSDDELLFQPSGLLKSPPAATKTASCSLDVNALIDVASSQRQSDHKTVLSAVISQEESSSSSSLVSPLQQPQTSTNGSATKTTSDDGIDSTKDTTNSIIGKSISIEEIIKEAQEVYKCKTLYHEINSTSLLKWYAKPTKNKKSSSFPRKQKRSTTNQYEVVLPCYICPNVHQAIAGYEDAITLPDHDINGGKGTTSLVRYIGFRASCRDKIQTVPTKHLLPYNYHGDENLKGKDLSVNTDATTGSDVKEVPSNQWNTNLMSLYLKSLQSNQQEFKKSNSNDAAITSNYKLQVEEQLLRVIASSTIEREKQQQSQNDSLDDDTDVDDESQPNNDAAVTSADNHASVTTTSTSKRENAKRVDRPVTTVTKLRAGDIIEYCPPHVVADKLNILRSTVMECYPRQDPAVLLATGHWLPRDHQIRIVQQRRILNSKKQIYKYIDTHPNESYVRISMLKLDMSHNGRMDDIVITSAERLRKMYNDTAREISSSNNDFINNNDDTSFLPVSLHPHNDHFTMTEKLEEARNENSETEKIRNNDLCGKKRKLRG